MFTFGLILESLTTLYPLKQHYKTIGLTAQLWDNNQFGMIIGIVF
jgi:hypothetical protein